MMQLGLDVTIATTLLLLPMCALFTNSAPGRRNAEFSFRVGLQSLTDRTLDQMCTVTRPGLASIAAATAVELLVSVLQHPAGYVYLCCCTTVGFLLLRICGYYPPPSIHAPPGQGTSDAPQPPKGDDSVLGLVPHQLRGYLAQFRNMVITGAAYHRCTGCSETVRSFLGLCAV